MKYLEDIVIKDTVFKDARSPISKEEGLALGRKLRSVTDVRYAFVKENYNVEPGCERVRNSTLKEEFEKNVDAKIDRDFSAFRKEYEANRICVDPRTDEHYVLYAIARSRPAGGLLIYNVDLVGRDAGVVQYEASAGPLTENPDTSSEIMLYLLDNPTDGFDDEGKPITMQLIEWKFPVEDVRNRWISTRDWESRWISAFQQRGYNLTMAHRDNTDFPTSLRKA